ncbi:MAG: nucleoside triphosphate pyrophosphohydrolase [Miltoncostaeaceae bacterium]
MIRIIALGPGDPDAGPAAARAAIDMADPAVIVGPPLDDALREAAGVAPAPMPDRLPDGAVVVATDADAHALAAALPAADTLPAREALRARAIGQRVGELAVVASRLRADCPWDRVQTAETIVPHTVEEAFEVAEAVSEGDPEHQADELGDLLFQSVFLSALLEEDGHADLATVARGQADKLISRHPHVYGDQAAEDAGAVVDIWEQRKRAERPDEGIFHELPPGLPALAYAAKAQKRAASAGFAFPDVQAALAKLDEEVGEVHADPGQHEVGDVIFAAVAVARAAGVDPEIAVRAAAARFRERVEGAAAMAADAGEDFESLPPDAQLAWYERFRARP